MVGSLTPSEEAQLAQTIEMFEVITQSQPHDYQSLEILKEAYAKLGREEDVMRASKRIAQVYVSLGQFSSAILEYESILQRYPDDADVLAALGEIESKAGRLPAQGASTESQTELSRLRPSPTKVKAADTQPPPADLDDGQPTMHKLFVEGKVITKAQFEQCWGTPTYVAKPTRIAEPFIQTLAEKGFVPLEKSLRLISDRARVGYLPLDKYDIDLDLARGFPVEICRRWCLVPFDRMSKSVLVATCNPFNRRAAGEVEACLKQRLLWFLTAPQDLLKTLRKVYR